MKETLYTFALGRFFTGLILAVTTSFISYTVGYGAGADFGAAVATSAGVLFAVGAYLAIDHTLSVFMPTSLKRLALGHIDFLHISLFMVALALLVATSASSLLSNKIISDFVYGDAPTHDDNILAENNKLDKSLAVFSNRVSKDSANLARVKIEEQGKVLAAMKHRDRSVRKQFESMDKTSWAWNSQKSPQLAGQRYRINKAIKARDKAIKQAQDKLAASEFKELEQTEILTASASAIIKDWQAIDMALQAENAGKKVNLSTYLIYIELGCGSLFLIFCLFVVGIEYKYPELTLPPRKSMLLWILIALPKLNNWIMSGFEWASGIDLNGDGHIDGRGPVNTEVDTGSGDDNREPAPDQLELVRGPSGVGVASDIDTEKLRQELAAFRQDVYTLKEENRELSGQLINREIGSQRREKPKTYKKETEKPRSLTAKGRGGAPKSLKPITEAVGWASLSPASKKKLLGTQKNLSGKKLNAYIKTTENAYQAVYKRPSKDKETVRRNTVKLNWGVSILRDNEYKVTATARQWRLE